MCLTTNGTMSLSCPRCAFCLHTYLQQKNALALPDQASSGFGGGGDTLKLPVIHSSNQDVNNPTELKQLSGNTGQEKPAVCPLKEGEMQEGGEAGDGGEAVETMRQDDDKDVDNKFITQPGKLIAPTFRL